MNFLKNIISTLVALVIFSLIVVSIGMGILFLGTSDIEVKNRSVLHIKLNGVLLDRSNSSDYSFVKTAESNNSLISIQKALKCAEKDTLIKGVFLEVGEIKGSLANVSSLKRTLENFKETGRKIIVHSDGLSQIGYYLASTADSIFVNSMANIEWKGLGAQLMYFKSMLDKIGVEAEPIRVGKYKSAIEPFIMDSMSIENEHQINEMLHDIWDNVLEDVSKQRKINIATLKNIADSLGYLMSDEALKFAFIDGLKYIDEISSCLDVIVGGEANLITVESYNEANKKNSFEESKIVVVNAEGAIVDDNSESDISSVRYSKIFDDILKDGDVKAVVLRINSPGGSALASEKMWRKLKLISSKMPLIVSMGNYAASGGYYMASAGDSILAEKNTITGSIGVFGLLFNVSKLTNEVGVKFEKVKTNQMSDFPSFDRKLSKNEKNRIQEGITSIYKTFIERVHEGRPLAKIDVERIAGGRVWTGNQALNIGLVDKLGGLDESIKIAANSAKIKDYEVLHLPKEKNPIEAVVNHFSGESKLRLPEPFSQYNYMIQNPEFFQTFSQPQARLPFVISID